MTRAAVNLAKDVQQGHVAVWTPWRRGGASSSDHSVLATIFARHVRPGDVLVDIGCGRGRVLAYWHRHFPNHKTVGIEIDPRLATAARRRFGRRAACRIIEGDAVTAVPDDATFIFMFNPFDADHVERLRLTLERRPTSDPPLRVVYSNPKHLAAFDADDGWSVARIPGVGSALLPHHDYAVIDRT